jgi:glycosyltransferase
MMRISIITVCYNAERTIEQTISSVLRQSYPDIEYIIIDGASTDHTTDIVEQYRSGIAAVISEPDNGIYDAMNKGVSVATGDYVQFLGADDCLVTVDAIQRVVDAMKDSVDVLSAHCIAVDEKYLCETIASNAPAQAHDASVLPFMPHTGIFMKRSLLQQEGFDVSYRIAADLKLLLKLYYTPEIQFQYVDFPVTYFSLGGISNKNRILAERENQRLFQELNLVQKPYTNPENGVSERMKIFIRAGLDYLHLLGSVRCLVGNWHRHHCAWRNCRWCKGKDG